MHEILTKCVDIFANPSKNQKDGLTRIQSVRLASQLLFFKCSGEFIEFAMPEVFGDKNYIQYKELVKCKTIDIRHKLLQSVELAFDAEPSLKAIFPATDLTCIKRDIVVAQAIREIDKLQLDQCQFDCDSNQAGLAFQEFCRASLGDKYPQFTASALVNEVMVSLLKFEHGARVLDLAVGSGGLLVEIVKQMRKSEGILELQSRICGQDVDCDMAKIAAATMFLHFGAVFQNIVNQETTADAKCFGGNFDVAVADISGFNSKLPTFIYAAIDNLADGGQCVISCDIGKPLVSRAQKFRCVRQKLVETCSDIRIVLFKNSASKLTKFAAIYFVKRKPAGEQKLWFCKYDNGKCSVKFEIADSLASHEDFVFDYKFYKQARMYSGTAVLLEQVELGSVCSVVPGTELRCQDTIPGPYAIIGQGKPLKVTYNQYNTEQNTILLSNTWVVQKSAARVWRTHECFAINVTSEQFREEFVYLQLQKQSAIVSQLKYRDRNYGVSEVQKTKIPVLPLEQQDEIIKKHQFLLKIVEDCTAMIRRQKKANKIVLDAHFKQICEVVNRVPLAEIANIKKGTQISQAQKAEGGFRIIQTSFNQDREFSKIPNTPPGSIIMLARGKRRGEIAVFDCDIWVSECAVVISLKENASISKMYLYWTIKSHERAIKTASQQQDIIEENMTVSMSSIESLQILVVPEKEQLELVKIYEQNEQGIAGLRGQRELYMKTAQKL